MGKHWTKISTINAKREAFKDMREFYRANGLGLFYPGICNPARIKDVLDNASELAKHYVRVTL